jgi:hypothetical protein
MRRSAILGIFMIVPALLVFTATPGCGKKDGGGGGKKGGGESTSTKKGETPEAKKGGGAAAGAKKPLEAELNATIKGQVTYDGDPPTAAFIEGINAHKDKAECLKGMDFEKNEQTWIVNKSNKGVANVVISLEPPAGTYFKLRDADKKRTDEVKLDQPHCAFIPHVVALFPVYFNGEKMVRTGQKFAVANGAKMPHNTKITGDPLKNAEKNPTLPPGKTDEFEINLQKNPLRVGCSFHTWMSGFIWTFDNPYHAVTDLDGKFTIENVPSGVELTVVSWHETKDKFKKDTMKFKSGDNTYDLKVAK